MSKLGMNHSKMGQSAGRLMMWENRRSEGVQRSWRFQDPLDGFGQRIGRLVQQIGRPLDERYQGKRMITGRPSSELDARPRSTPHPYKDGGRGLKIILTLGAGEGAS